MFCVPEVSGQNDARTLEDLSGGLLLSIEALAEEELRLWEKAHGENPQ